MTWRCSNCTARQEDDAKVCRVCRAERPVDSLENLFTLQSLIKWQCSKCKSVNSGNKVSCGKCSAIGTWSSEDQDPDFSLLEAECLKKNCLSDVLPFTTGFHWGKGFSTGARRCHLRQAFFNMGKRLTTWAQASRMRQEEVLELDNMERGSRLGQEVEDLGTTMSTRAGGSRNSPTPPSDSTDDSLCHAGSTTDYEDPELRIVLIGRTGEGKSATGNTILDEDVFESSLASASVTKECQRGTCTRFGRYIQVIDTPGMYDTEMTIPDITREVIKCVGMTAPGPHVFLLVIKPDRFTEEVQNTVDLFFQIFGERMLNHLIIVFTKKDELVYDGKTIDEYVHCGSDKLKSLLQSCNNRYLTFNNRGTTEEKEEDVKNLLVDIDEVVRNNRGVYTNEMFKHAETIVKEKEEKLRREHEEKVARETREIRQQCDLHLRTVEENYADIIRQLQKRVHDLDHQQETDTSHQELKHLKELLADTKGQQKEELDRFKKSANLKLCKLKNQKINFREKVREEICKGTNFMKETLLPGLFKVAKKALPVLLSIGISVLVALV